MELIDYRRALHVRSQAELHERLLARGITPTPSKGPALPAYVNHGRLVADCDVCGSGVACAMDEAGAVCFGCGTIHAITRPDPAELHAVLVVLAQRPSDGTRNWRPGKESRDEVAAENWAHGSPTFAPAPTRRPGTIERER